MIPIYKDTYYYVPASASPFDYSIVADGETIFNGRAYVAPDENQIRIRVNGIAEDYLTMDFPALSGTTTHDDAAKTFSVYHEGSLVTAFTFCLDWSYESGEVTSGSLSHPINGHGCSGMVYFNTTAAGSSISTSASSTPNSAYTEGYCGTDYALYYLNRYGGWDCFYIEGLVRRKDEYDRMSITTVFNNNTKDWGKRNYNNQISPAWEVHTGWLNDSQSDNLAFNLLSSNQVYLHNLKKNEIIPVVLTDAEAEYKTFVGNQRRMVNYTINISASQTQQNIS